MSETVTLTIDGKKVTAPKGMLLVEAAKLVGIEIPVFCYHPKLKPMGACRMCIVEIEGIPKPQPSCSTPVAEGMVVKTKTPEVQKMWDAMLEFLLINHPLDCPVCDRGGECPLQDNTFKYGSKDSRFSHEKRHFSKPVPLSPLIVLDRERCIMCFRCVRFCQEISDHPQIQFFSRGDREHIDTFPGKPFDSNFSGNTIELCPVGALLSSVFRFRARPWEIKSTPSICPNCGVGCNIKIDARNNRQVVRFLARPNSEVNDEWLCDRGRFDSSFINSPERLRSPMIRKNGELQEVDWDEALDFAAAELKRLSADPHQLGGIGSPRASNEQNYLFQKLMRTVLGTNNLDYKISPRSDTGADAVAQGITAGLFNGSIRDILEADTVLILGSDISYDLPLIDLWIKKAYKSGVKIVLANPLEVELSRYASPFAAYRDDQAATVVEGLSQAALGENAVDYLVRSGIAGDTAQEISKTLGAAKRLLIMVDIGILEGINGLHAVQSVKRLLDSFTGRNEGWARALLLSDGGNAQGAMDVGLLPGYLPGFIPNAQVSNVQDYANTNAPDWKGLGGYELIGAARDGNLKAMYVMENDPVGDPLYGESAREGFEKLEFLIVQDYFLTSTAEMAHVVLPSTTFAENTGTFTNIERRIQRFSPAIRRLRGARDDAEIIADLAERLGAKFEYASEDEIFKEISHIVPQYAGIDYAAIGNSGIQWNKEGKQ